MKMSAPPDTNVLKAVVTIEDKIDLERKGKQSLTMVLAVPLFISNLQIKARSESLSSAEWYRTSENTSEVVHSGK